MDFPLWTHVKLTAPGYEIAHDRPIPDTLTRVLTLTAVSRRYAYVEVYRNPKIGLPGTLYGFSNERGKQNNREVTLRRIRMIAPGRALYRAERQRGATTFVGVFGTDTKRTMNLREMDLRGGMAEPLDLRE